MKQRAFANQKIEEQPARTTTDRASDFPWMIVSGIMTGLIAGFAGTALADYLKK